MPKLVQVGRPSERITSLREFNKKKKYSYIWLWELFLYRTTTIEDFLLYVLNFYWFLAIELIWCHSVIEYPERSSIRVKQTEQSFLEKCFSFPTILSRTLNISRFNACHWISFHNLNFLCIVVVNICLMLHILWSFFQNFKVVFICVRPSTSSPNVRIYLNNFLKKKMKIYWIARTTLCVWVVH